MNRRLSRRDFVKGAVASGAATVTLGALSACGKTASARGVPSKWDAEADVVVVGFGGAGSAAALMAQEKGAKVLILEKGDAGGGSTALCGQATWGAGTSVQKAAGIDDSVEDGVKYILAAADGREDLLKLLATESASVVDWLSGLGVHFVAKKGGVPGVSYGGLEFVYEDITPPVERTHWADTTKGGIWIPLAKAVEAEGIEVRTGTPVTGLIRNDETGEIVGVTADSSGTTIRVKANKAVILAAGGFSRNKNLTAAHISNADIVPFTGLNDDGDGQALGESVGAGVHFLSGNLGVPTYTKPVDATSLLVPGAIPEPPAFICVNLGGKRFADEGQFYLYTNEQIIAQAEHKAYIITCGDDGLVALGEKQEHVVSDTVEGLAQALGVDPSGLKATLEKWNADSDTGTDSVLGRTSALKPITPPYYGAMTVAGTASTLGGLNVDIDMRVLTALGEKPIPRLYAAGINSGGLGRFYPACGSAVNMVLVTGRKAGSNAAALESWA